MTLIFSNDNRLLFNRESNDRLLELRYANRFPALSSYKKLYKQESTSLDPLFKPCKDQFFYKTDLSKNRESLAARPPDTKKAPYKSFCVTCVTCKAYKYKSKICKELCTTPLTFAKQKCAKQKCAKLCKAKQKCAELCTCICKRSSLTSYKTEFCTKTLTTLISNQKSSRVQATLLCSIKNQDTASLALQSFSAIEILSLYGLLQNQPVLIQSFLKNYFACVQSFTKKSVTEKEGGLAQRVINSQDQTTEKKFKKLYNFLKSPFSASRPSVTRNTFLLLQNPVLSATLAGFVEEKQLQARSTKLSDILCNTLKPVTKSCKLPFCMRFGAFDLKNKHCFQSFELLRKPCITSASASRASRASLLRSKSVRSFASLLRSKSVRSKSVRSFAKLLTKLCFVTRARLPLSSLLLRKSVQSKSEESGSLARVQSFAYKSTCKSKICTCTRFANRFVRVTFAKQKLAEQSLARSFVKSSALVNAKQKCEFCNCNTLHTQHKALFYKKNGVALLRKGLIFVNLNKKWIDTALIADCFAFLKEKLSTIKQFFPKTRVWGFAFGSSFLLVSMTSILQRQEQSRWLLTFSKNQMPGLSLTLQESSWESFENIALRHLNRKRLNCTNLIGKGLVKQIDCYKNICYISFSESWNQQFFQNYTAVFPSRGQSFAGKKLNKALHANQSFVKATGFSIKKSKWLAPPWYQMHARIPPKKPVWTCFTCVTCKAYKAELCTTPLTFASQKCAKLCKAKPCTCAYNYKTPFSLIKTNGFKEQVNAKNDSIPSKMSCSMKVKDSSFYGSTVKSKLTRALSQHDRLRDLFYNSSNFSIDAQVFQENSQETDSLHDISFFLKERKNDFERLMDTNRFLFLQENGFFKGDPDRSAQHKKPKFGYPLNLVKNKKDVFQSQNEALHSEIKKRYRSYQSSRHTLRMKDGENALKKKRFFKPEGVSSSTCFFPCVNHVKSDTSSYTNLNPNLSKSVDKLSTYFLYKRNSVSNRLMSGYKAPETKDLQLKKTVCLSKVSIKVPPALPFYESKIKEWGFSLQNKAFYCFPEQLSIPPSFINPFQKDQAPPTSVNNKQLFLKLSPKEQVALTPRFAQQNLVRKSLTHLLNRVFIKTNRSFPAIRFRKRMPYKQLFLNESKEIEPLFEQVNKAFRISPYRFTFKRSLFTDYSDYLSWSKDTPAAISIASSVEEEEAIKNSWLAEQALSRGLEGEALDSALEPSVQERKEGENLVFDEQEGNENKGERFVQRQAQSSDSQERALFPSINEKSFEDSTTLTEEEAVSASLPVGEEEDKKREITKFEWLQQVREAEHMVEKRKDLQRVAYPNREALFSRRLHVKPGMTQSLLVGDRKLSFFGITNLFPKRLIAKDQKQINLQILQEEHDQRSCLLLEEASLKNDELQNSSSFELKGEKTVLIENLLKSGALGALAEQKQIFAHVQLQNSVLSCKAYKALLCKKSGAKGGQKQDRCKASNKTEFCNSVTCNYKSKLSKASQKCEFCKPKGKELAFSLRTAPRNQQKNDARGKQSFVRGYAKQALQSLGYQSTSEAQLSHLQKESLPTPNPTIFRARQHPVYAPNRRLRLRAPQLSSSSQSSNPQSRLDELNLSQSHRWWQKRRTTSSLLGAPSKRYLVMPEIKTQDWRKIVEWQLRTYFLEEEKRLEPLLLKKNETQKAGVLSESFLSALHVCKANVLQNGVLSEALQEELFLDSEKLSKTSHLFKIKKISIYLPWTTLKKSLKKPFEWPLTGLSYQSINEDNDLVRGTVTENECGALRHVQLQNSHVQGLRHFCKTKVCEALYDSPHFCKALQGLQSKALYAHVQGFALQSFAKVTHVCQSKVTQEDFSGESFTTNKKPDSCFVSSISPHFKTSFFSQSNQISKPGMADTLATSRSTKIALNRLHETSVYKPFLFEARTKDSHLLLHQLLLAVATKQLFQSIYKIFEKVVTHKIKNSSLAILLLPIFFNATAQRTQIPEFSHLKKRLKDLVGSEDTVSSLSEIIWYLRNSCRGRMIPRGVVLVETFSSESTDYLKAIGGEAQVPVIVQSLRALPFTQNHPQRRLEKILTFAQKRAPCILFLDDLDSIGQSRTLLLKNSHRPLPLQSSVSKTEPFSFALSFNQIVGNNGEGLEKRKWKKVKNNSNSVNRSYLSNTLMGLNLPLSSTKQRFARFDFLGVKPRSGSFSVQSQCHACSSYFRYKPFVKQHKKKRFVQQDGLAGTKVSTNGFKNENRENNALQKETEKVVEQRRVDLMLRLLTVMDGITNFNGVLIVTTSKNPSSLDPALLRPGRFEKFINIQLPNKKKRIELLKLETAKIGHTSFMPWEFLGTQTQDMTGTEISSAVNHSAFRAILQSTVHTFPTLEYGISCINGDGSLTQNVAVQVENRFQRTPEMKGVGVASNEYTHVTRPQDIRRSACFLRKISVENPYKVLLNKTRRLSTRSCKSQICFSASRDLTHVQSAHVTQKQLCAEICQQSKKVRKIASQLAFYQAGQWVVRSSILRGNKPSGQICLTRDESHQHNSIRSSFAKKIVRLYAGQASESLYLDSMARFKNKALQTRAGDLVITSDPSQQFLFLHSTFSCKERSRASSTVANIVTNSGFYPKRDLVLTSDKCNYKTPFCRAKLLTKPLASANFCKAKVTRASRARLRLAKLRKSDAREGSHTKLRFVSLARVTKQSFVKSFAYKSTCKSKICTCTRFASRFVRLALQTRAKVTHLRKNDPHNFLSEKRNQRLYKTLFCKQRAEQQTHGKTFATSKEGSFCFQGVRKRVVRKLKYLSSTNFFEKNFCVGSNKYSHLRKCLQLCRDNGRNGLCNKISQKGFALPCNKSSLWVQKISGTLKTFKRQSGNWYRLYLPKVEQTKNNREWLLPDFFDNQHIFISKQKDLQDRVLKLQRFSKSIPSTSPLRKKICSFTPAFVYKNRFFKQKESRADLAYYSMVLSGFYVAFQSCTENRELLDLLADHLIRFKAVRLHEIARIASFYF